MTEAGMGEAGMTEAGMGEAGMRDELEDWVARANLALGLSDEVDVAALLDLAREVAHGVARPAAPVTAYLLGLAVGRGADPVAARAVIAGLLNTP